MPIFEYQCTKCGNRSEFLENADDREKHVCPKCGSSQMNKLFSGFGVGKGNPSTSGSCPTGTCSLS
jgi:putative FmdB family regulatory protein